jgi:protoporphyrin/coproporphyrin ferrochelatase
MSANSRAYWPSQWPNSMRRAIVLMNLGGPDSLEAVRPFLVNLFSDPAIIALPHLLRGLVARLIASRRLRFAIDIYEYLGGGSPLLGNTKAQARALEQALGNDSRCFIAMRYWHPLTAETVAAVKAWSADDIVCLPLYPQYSTATTASSLAEWQREAARMGLERPTRMIKSYPTAPGFISALAECIAPVLDNAEHAGPCRLLFSAHGLPLKIVRAGDPYPEQIAQTAAAVVAALRRRNLDWAICYQSRVGPLAWLGPGTDDEIRRAGGDRVAVVVAPISFVSEHSETLVELDRDYRRLAAECGVPAYYRTPTVGTAPSFISALAGLVATAAA